MDKSDNSDAITIADNWLRAAGDYPQSGGPLTIAEVTELTEKYGPNTVVTDQATPCFMIFLHSLIHPFNILLIIIALLSVIASIEDNEYFTLIIISVMVIISTIIRFYQEFKSEGAVANLLKLINKNVSVVRYDTLEPIPREMNISSEQVVPGDWVILRPGEVVPADGVIVKSKVFYVSQAPLTGEALPVEKYSSAEKALLEGNTDYVEPIIPREYSGETICKKPKRKCMCRRMCLSACGCKVHRPSVYSTDDPTLKANLSTAEKVFMGSQVISGMATMRVTKTGYNTIFGKMAVALSQSDSTNAFQRGVKRVSWIFFILMIIMMPPIFLIYGFTNRVDNEEEHKTWIKAFLFSLAVAVGLTPEMLPMIVNANLAKGSRTLTKRQAIVKKLDSIINLGAVDILCTDKTGTLTKSVVTLESVVNPYGESATSPLQIGYLNSYFQSVLQNPLDSAILNFFEAPPPVSKTSPNSELRASLEEINGHDLTFVQSFSRLDEIPFDFIRRRLSVLLKYEKDGKVYLICKGAVEEMLAVCQKSLKPQYVHAPSVVFPPDTETVPLTEALKDKLLSLYLKYTNEGERVLAVGYKLLPSDRTGADAADESDLILVGFLTFIDPPKPTTLRAIKRLRDHNVEIKVLTGDAANICAAVCKSIELPVKSIVTGSDIESAVKHGTLGHTVENGTIFAKLTPLQKALVVQTLRDQHHVVAMLGDGINDAPSLKEADVGISVENGVDICRDAADIILLDKDLQVVVEAIRIGRTTYGNTIKYIAMVMSSNFGNVFSMLVATSWLPFGPMTSLQVLTQNLLYDISQIAIPWDSVDEEFLLIPHKWRMKVIIRFMLFMGPWSSVFDIATFLYLWFKHKIQKADDEEGVRVFNTTWFTVGLLTQTLIVHIIRSPKISFIQTRASLPLTILTIIVVAAGLVIPLIPKVNKWLGFSEKHLSWDLYVFTAGAIVAYCIVATIVKLIYVKIFKEWF